MQSQWLFLGLVLLGVIDLTVSYDVWTLAAANSKFALRLYDKIVKDSTGDNVFFSPFRYAYALFYLKKHEQNFSFTATEIPSWLPFRNPY